MKKKTGTVDGLLREVGAVLIRQKNHRVYRLPNGRNFVIAKSASDKRAERNNLATLRKLIGQPQTKGVSANAAL